MYLDYDERVTIVTLSVLMMVRWNRIMSFALRRAI